MSEMIRTDGRGLQLNSMDDMIRFAETVVKSRLAPDSFKDASQILIALQYGAEMGFTPMASLQSLCVVNGKICLYGDTMRAMCERDSVCEAIEVTWKKLPKAEEKYSDETTCEVRCKRRDRTKATIASFSVKDAKQAGLWMGVNTKDPQKSAWWKYPKRMLYYRALSMGLREAFPDVVKGLHSAEEMTEEAGFSQQAALQSGDQASIEDLDDMVDHMESDHTTGFTSVVGADLLDEKIAAEEREEEPELF